jgi:oligopeptide transport system substrate-binding protein
MIGRLAAAFAILTAGLLVSCGPPTITRTACAPGKVCIERGANGESQTLDPHKSSSTTEDEIDADLFVGLTQFDANANVVPGMATSWEASPDGLVWTFQLRDAKWSDGTPVTADDFVFSLGRAMDPKTASPYASLLYLIKNAQAVNEGKLPPSAIGARAIDAHTLEITLNHPAPYLPNLAVHTMMAPIPRHIYEKWGDDHWADPGHMVGNGPYTLAIWKLGDKIEERKNPLFWDADKVCGDVVRWYPITDSISAERRVRRVSWTCTRTFSRIASPSCVSRIRFPPIFTPTPGWVSTIWRSTNNCPSSRTSGCAKPSAWLWTVTSSPRS